MINYTIENVFSWDKKPIVKIGTIENIEGTSNDVSKALAILGRKCLDFIDSRDHAAFKKSYRIEIVPVNHPQWEFQLYIPTENWFDMLYYVKAKNVEEKNIVLATAREYVNSVRSSYRPSLPETSLTPVLSRKYCATHANCISINRTGKKHDSRYAEPRIFCGRNDVPQQSKKPATCNWYAENEQVVSHNQKQSYVVLSRQDHIREILVAPLDHKTNRELVVDNVFWNTILKEVVKGLLWQFREQTYPVECYAISFGAWESETAKDKNALECHAHFHLHLNKVVVHSMEQEKDIYGNYFYHAIHGKVNDPFQYRMKDCVELETLRLSSLEINANYNSLRKQIDEQGKKIDEIHGLLKSFVTAGN